MRREEESQGEAGARQKHGTTIQIPIIIISTMGLSSSKVVQCPGETQYLEEESKTYLGEKITKVKVGAAYFRRVPTFVKT